MNAGAITAWNAGATGAGISIAVVDSGIDTAEADLQGRISPLSTDIVPGRGMPYDTDQHGTWVSGVIASNFNDFGTIGYAYQSTIVSIRADTADCDDPDDKVCFTSTNLARAIDYAIANNVRVINMSLGGEGALGSTFEAAMLRAVNAGIVFAISAGNEFDDDPAAAVNPGYPGRYATDPRFAGSIIVVGAHDVNNTIAAFSNRAGVSASRYISAPGVRVVTNCDGTQCYVINGTSFSAPAVAGAMALLLQAFPNLTGRQAVDILLNTARDAGDAGQDAVYGRGLLDIARAFQPVGSTSVKTASGSTVEVTTERFAYTGRPFGDALRVGQGMQTVGHDAYDRLFRVDLADAYGLAPRTSLPRAAEAPRQQATLKVDAPFGGTLALTSGASIDDTGYDLASASSAITPWLDDRRREDVMVQFSAGAGTVAVWQGRNGARSPFELGAADDFASLAQVDRAWLGAVHLGALTFTADAGVGDRQMPFQTESEDVSRYARFAAGWQATPEARFKLAGGSLDERMGPLGSYVPLGSGFELPSQTGFGSFAGEFDLGRGLRLDAEMGWSRTDISGQFLRLVEPAFSSSWRLGLTSACAEFGLGCQALTWSVSQPLRTESGAFAAQLADAPLAYFDPLTFSERRFSASPTGRQIDIALGSLHRLKDGSYLNLRAIVTRDDQHIAAAPASFTLTGAWRTQF
ncbi:S8 family peptidase [Brevundimonas sp. NPDC092305]|uniref:S8 family peptidase n=1 Tax=Brevundimonas sp. NPDC092305 TaxID=3363957 RepID=UPI0037F1677B